MGVNSARRPGDVKEAIRPGASAALRGGVGSIHQPEKGKTMENINLIAFGTAYRRISSNQAAVIARLEKSSYVGNIASLAQECGISDSSAFRAQLDALFDGGVLSVSYVPNKTRKPTPRFALAPNWAQCLIEGAGKMNPGVSGAFTVKSPTGDLYEATSIPAFLRAHVEDFPNQKSAEIMLRTKGRAYGWEIIR